MFGYVKPRRDELLVRQAEYYRAAYCGLCRAMRKSCGFFTSFALSYDFAFLTVVRTALSGEHPTIESRRCPIHPLKKRSVFARSRHTDYCAAAAVLLIYRKLLDDIGDERGWRRLKARLALPIFSAGRRRVLRRNPSLAALDTKIADLLSELSDTEKENAPSADTPAEIFGRLLGEILSFELEGTTKKVCAAFGCAVGHWIYLADAADDLSDDCEKGRYNPILSLYGNELDDKGRHALRTGMIATLCRAESAFDLMEGIIDGDALGIIKNVLFLGLPDVTDEVLKLKKCDCEKKSKKKGICRGCSGCGQDN